MKDEIQGTSTTRTYDAFKHILTEVQSNGLELSYTYHHDGLLKSVVLPDNSKVSYTFNAGLLESANRTSSTGSYDFAVTKRNSAGMIVETSLPFTGGTVQYSYDQMGHVLSKQQQKASETRVYDQIGRVASRTIDGTVEQYQYDFLSQIISDNGRAYAFDSLFRLREKEGESTEVTLRQQITKLGKKSFVYDLDGRRVRDGDAVLKYDALGRLISYRNGGHAERYEYDGFSRRMKTTFDSTVERYLWMGQQDIGTYDEENHPLSFRLLAEGVGTEGGATIAVELNGTPYVAFSDLSGNIRSLVSVSGQEVHTATYSAFMRTSTTGLDCPWGFFSKRHDAQSGYVMFLYRLYDPVTCTWITQDPLGLEGGPNLYAYVKNNPLSLFDMLGLFDCGSFCDSCCSFVSDCCSAVYDAVSSACDSISSGCSAAYDYCSSCASSVGNAIASGASWAGSSVASGLKSMATTLFPRAMAEHAPPQSSYVMHDGTVIDAKSKLKAGAYVYGFGTWEDFKKYATKHPEVWTRVSKTSEMNGVNTTALECLQRAQAIKEQEKNVDYVVFFYNPIESFPVQAGKAAANAMGIMTEEVLAIKEQLMDFLDTARNAGVTGFSIQAHSQGAAILDCILHTKEFNKEDKSSYFHCLGPIDTYGAATFISCATNHVAYFDMVPFLNPRNWVTMITHPECVQFTSFAIQSPLGAHGFEKPSYQEAFQSRKAR